MRKVLKSYMIAFVKSWVETIGTILFLLMQCAIVLGMLSAPLQINYKVSTVQKQDKPFDYYMSADSYNFTDDFIYQYFVETHEDVEGDAPEFHQHHGEHIAYSEMAPDGSKVNKLYDPFVNGDEKKSNLINVKKFDDAHFNKNNGLTEKFDFVKYRSDYKDYDAARNDPNTTPLLNLIRQSLNDATWNDYKSVSSSSSSENVFANSNNNILGELYLKYLYNQLPNGGEGTSNHQVDREEYNYNEIEGAGIRDIYDSFFEFGPPAGQKNIIQSWDYDFTITTGQPPKILSYDFRPSDNKNEFSSVSLDKGSLPKDYVDNSNTNQGNQMDVVVSSAYAKANKLGVGDLLVSAYGYDLIISGIGTSYDSIMNGPGFSVFSGSGVDTYAYVFTTHNNLDKIYQKSISTDSSRATISNEQIVYRVKENQKGILSKTGSSDPINNKGVFLSSGSAWETRKSDPSVASLKNVTIQVILYVVLGVILLILAFIFINFVIKKELTQSRVQIGIFKAMGYTSRELSWIFALKTLITIMIGLILGYFISFPIQIYAAGQFSSSVAVSFHAIYAGPIFLFAVLIVVPLIFMGISYLLTLRDLKESSLDLISNAARKNKSNYFLIFMSVIFFPLGIITLVNKLRSRIYAKYQKRFTWRMKYSFTKSGIGKFVMVISLISFSSFMFMTLLSTSTVMKTLVDNGFNSLSRDADNSITWDGHNGLKVEQGTSKDDHQIILNKKYAQLGDSPDKDDDYWKPADLKYVDYSKDGYLKTTQNTFNLNRAAKIQSIFDDSINILTTDEFASDSDPKIDNVLEIGDVKINKMALKTVISMLFNDLTATQDDTIQKTTALQSISLEANDDLQHVINLFQGSFNNSLFNMPAINSIDGGKQNMAFYMRDFAKFACEFSLIGVTDFSKNNNFMPNCGTEWGQKWLSNHPVPVNSGEPDDSDFSNQLNNVFASLTGMSLMLDNKNKNYMPLITANTILFDKTKDFLYYQLQGAKRDGENIGDPIFRLIDSADTSGNYGKISNGFNLSPDALNKISSLQNGWNETQTNSETHPLNAIVSYRFLKGLGDKVGDIISVDVGTTIKKPVYIKIIGIDINDTFTSTVTVDDIDFMNQVVSIQSKDKDRLLGTIDEKTKQRQPIFNSVISQNPAISGNINLKNIADSIRNLVIKSKTFTIAMVPNASMMETIFSSFIEDIPSILGNDLPSIQSKIDPNMSILNAVSLSVQDTSDTLLFTPFKITHAIVNQITNIVNLVMILFIVLSAFLLLIVLIVIMNIVVDEAQRIILTMRAIGYKNSRINWMIMGNYILWAFIGFVIAYGFLIGLWEIFSKIIWAKFSIIINIPFAPSIPLMAFAVIGLILIGGWISSMQRINHQPLTQITD